MTDHSARRTVYVSIGNSDDKLTQSEWVSYVFSVRRLLDEDTWDEDRPVVAMHGSWYSLPDSPYQNACWCIEVEGPLVDELKSMLAKTAGLFRQDSTAWAEAVTEFIGGSR